MNHAFYAWITKKMIFLWFLAPLSFTGIRHAFTRFPFLSISASAMWSLLISIPILPLPSSADQHPSSALIAIGFDIMLQILFPSETYTFLVFPCIFPFSALLLLIGILIIWSDSSASLFQDRSQLLHTDSPFLLFHAISFYESVVPFHKWTFLILFPFLWSSFWSSSFSCLFSW